jgi:hypothetical protein
MSTSLSKSCQCVPCRHITWRSGWTRGRGAVRASGDDVQPVFGRPMADETIWGQFQQESRYSSVPTRHPARPCFVAPHHVAPCYVGWLTPCYTHRPLACTPSSSILACTGAVMSSMKHCCYTVCCACNSAASYGICESSAAARCPAPAAAPLVLCAAEIAFCKRWLLSNATQS